MTSYPKIVQILQEHALQQNVERRNCNKVTLKEHIDDIRKRLEPNEFPNEAAVRQGIINRLLGVLNWPTYDIQVVFPEYPVDSGNVDYALCHPISQPRVFIEVKRVDSIDKGTEQLFEYAYQSGVTNLILTDGKIWRFYHPAGEGSYEDRMVAEVNFVVEDSEKCANSLDRYLNYESVKTGKVAKVIVEDYQNIVNQRQIKDRLPEVWHELVQEKNEYLLLAMMEKAKDKIGHEPTEDQVLTFLNSLKKTPEFSQKHKQSQPGSEYTSDFQQTSSVQQELVVTMLNGEVINHKRASNTFVEVIEKLGIERVKDLNKKYIIPLISDSEHPKYNQGKSGNYYIMTGSSTKTKKRLLDEIALDLGVRLDVEIVDKN